eukprot:TRINITY_DN104729_c0_g1_i1.p1 TRINITY_DN104729_c0_g1~~TRINITY_DN104729_c0_g1_i1.p1  ORF type:complete len:133 (+),score=1.47 TRINITY_DN104729_c0_g1_i1:325-723(+)
MLLHSPGKLKLFHKIVLAGVCYGDADCLQFLKIRFGSSLGVPVFLDDVRLSQLVHPPSLDAEDITNALEFLKREHPSYATATIPPDRLEWVFTKESEALPTVEVDKSTALPARELVSIAAMTIASCPTLHFP